MKQRGRVDRFTAIHRADPKLTWDAKLPLAVLVDEGSASASEVLAGALSTLGPGGSATGLQATTSKKTLELLTAHYLRVRAAHRNAIASSL